MDDEALDKECERVLEQLDQSSDLEYDFDEDEVVTINPTDLPRRVLDTEHLPKISEEVPQTEVREDIEDEEQIFEEELHSIEDFSVTKKTDIKWKKATFLKYNFVKTPQPMNEVEGGLMNPLDYFLRYLPEDTFSQLAEMTNLYALQQGKNFNPCNASEIKSLFGLHILMSCLRFPRVRMYWNQTVGMPIFRDTMPRDRFFQLRSNLHIVNNLEKTDECKDRLYKVRPLYDCIRKRCLELEMEQDLCVDEQMVPFTGNLSILQYVKGKPCPWGIKIFMLCGKSGLVHDFVIYQGATTEFDKHILGKFGLGATAVLKLSERIPCGHSLYFDNYFTTYNLLEILRQKSIHAAGTARVNRFSKPPLLSDKEATKKNRGYSEEVISNDGIILCKWVDNRCVTLASNFVGVGEEDTVKRWEKSKKEYIHISRPEVVKLYNFCMGGVDKFDQMVGYYRIFIKSKKWTLRMLFHAVDVACTNSWLEYRQDAKDQRLSKNKQMDFLDFKIRLADSLIKVGKPTARIKKTIGRPSRSTPPSTPTPTKKGFAEVRPFREVQIDKVDHMPEMDDNKEATRCKNSNCKGKTHVFCIKCNVHLCFVKGRNCFKNFHS